MPRCLICQARKVNFFITFKDYTYCKCVSCKTLFLQPTPTKKFLSKFYQEDFSYEEGMNNEQQIRKRAKIILRNLHRIHPEGKTLLDVGSAYGLFLAEAKKYNLQATGIEPSIKSRLKNVYNLSFEEYWQKYKKRFDFITVTHVIEHARNPEKWLTKLSSLLNSRGILYIETPNLDSHLFYAEKYYYTFLTPPNHIFLFSKYSFLRMLKNVSDLKLIKIKTYSYPEHLMGIIKRILKVKNAKISVSNDLRAAQRSIKYLLFDKILARLFYRLLNINGYGSILELYIRRI